MRVQIDDIHNLSGGIFQRFHDVEDGSGTSTNSHVDVGSLIPSMLNDK